MNTDPNKLTHFLRVEAEAAVDAACSTMTVAPGHILHLLDMIAHQDDQLSALRAMAAAAKPLPYPATATEETICQEADRIVSLDRQKTYGRPKDDFSRTAAMWEPIFGLPPGAISPEKVPMAMICVKLSRLCHGYKRDSAVDIAGYAKTLSMVHEAG